jgi:hypothetical protein
VVQRRAFVRCVSGIGVAILCSSVPAWSQRSSSATAYSLGPNAAKLYPDAAWLPKAYAAIYPSLDDTIAAFTKQSLAADGISATVNVQAGKITLTSTDPHAAWYAKQHAALFDEHHAALALAPIAACQKSATPPAVASDASQPPKGAGCWDPYNMAGPSPYPLYPTQPWALFLPLGLAMVNQQAVLLLDYPPAVSLKAKWTPSSDTTPVYLQNYTMERWGRILANAALPSTVSPLLFETIVDSRPMAAPGSAGGRKGPDGKPLPSPSAYLPPPTAFGGTYTTAMLSLLTSPPSNTGAHSLPVQVLGGPAQAAWHSITHQEVKTLGTGSYTFSDTKKTSMWVAGNHPDFTTYLTCPASTGGATSSTSMPGDVIAGEKLDLEVACLIRAFAANAATDVQAAQAKCRWNTGTLSAADTHTVCVQAMLDNNTPRLNCFANPHAYHTLAQRKEALALAEQFCKAHDDNPCPSDATARCLAGSGRSF